MGFSKLSTTLVSLALLGQASADLPSIIMKGTKFFYENGTQFFIKGVAYQQDIQAGGATTGSTFTDPLSNPSLCSRDIPILTAAGTNTIRTYAIDPTADHSECMAMLQSAGIYVISDLSEPALSINRANPQWNTDLYARYTAVVDEMSQYSNVIGFFAGNEVTNNNSNTAASAFVKAAVRDTKAYITSKGGRWMGVGYAANDDADIRANIAHYFNCGNQSEAIDYWGYNIYEWCGESSFVSSGYAAQVEFFSNYSVPVFFAEYGCNTVGGAEGRLWEETTALYSDNMTGVISGGIVYMYFEETNDYGIVTIESNGDASTMKNYASLKSRVLAATPASTAMSEYTPTNSPAACPLVAEDWVAGDILPPTPNAEACECMFNSISCAPAPGLETTAYGAIFDYICGQSGNICAGIDANVSTGVYGAFSPCNDTQKLGYVLDAYYKSQNNNAGACNFDSQAMVTAAASAAASCSPLLSSASSANGVAATATAGSSSSSSNVAAPIPIRNAITIGDVAIGLYVLVAVGVGASMVVL